MSSLNDLLKRAQEIRAKYDELNANDGHTKWSASDYTAGFVGDVGDLMKLVMAKEGKRRGDDVDAKLQHVLSDCLWSLLIIAAEYDIDLERSFFATMDELEKRLVTV
ncbi:MAG TPA: nucleotide pyrophosphohydrolase [Candidatus Saccharibacteria bacterium]|nr:nucleotide pyrophosphohydrolase [Candidatus Saccharibacteria bacterium]